jgi:hypothetical protein
MTTAQLQPLLAVLEDPWRAMGGGLRGENVKIDVWDVVRVTLITAAVVGLVWVLARLTRSQRRRSYYNPRALFTSLCKAHGLDWNSRHLLSQLATAHRLEHPARLFLEPERFSVAGSGSALAAYQAELDRLRIKLFGSETKPPSAKAPQPTTATSSAKPAARVSR